jgi:hypothetical protein
MELPPTIERKEFQIDAACAAVDVWASGIQSCLLCIVCSTSPSDIGGEPFAGLGHERRGGYKAGQEYCTLDLSKA